MSRAMTEARQSTLPRKDWISITSGTWRRAATNSSKARGLVLSSVKRRLTSTAQPIARQSMRACTPRRTPASRIRSIRRHRLAAVTPRVRPALHWRRRIGQKLAQDAAIGGWVGHESHEIGIIMA